MLSLWVVESIFKERRHSPLATEISVAWAAQILDINLGTQNNI